jgi:4-hydroxybenzoate polyprenyltransferase
VEQTADIDRGGGQTAASLAEPIVRAGLLGEARALAQGLRPRQWAKNGLLLLAFVFSIGQAWRPGDPGTWTHLLLRALAGVVVFCALSSATYLVNDLRDLERDRLHPTKRRRPLASGRLGQGTAVVAAVVLFAAGTVLAARLGVPFLLVAVAYAVLTLAYSFGLKHLVIIDLLIIAGGFVLRAMAGGLAIGVPISPWLYLCTLLGALFLAINKRRHELRSLGADAGGHRPGLEAYTTELLDQMAGIVTASTVVAYALYTVTAENLPSNHVMLTTLPFVLYGIFRYMYLVHRQDAGGSPEEVLLQDRPLQVTVLLWVGTAATLLAVFRP